MTQVEKLEALIEKAAERGWVGSKNGYNIWLPVSSLDPMVILFEGPNSTQYNYQAIVFDKDFARALFGEKTMEDLYRDSDDEYLKVANIITWVSGYEWDYYARLFEIYLQGAVISDNPIDYMYEAVFGKGKL